jgi:hypothetical protein
MKIRKTSSEYDRLTVLTYHSHHSTWNMLPMNVIFQCPLQEVSQSVIPHYLFPRSGSGAVNAALLPQTS